MINGGIVVNRGIVTALSAIGIAQLLKLPLQKQISGRWDWSAIWTTGGMPSSHSAGVTSLATYVALRKGFCSAEFALSSIFGMIVMYDAMGVRRHAGEIAIEVNQLRKQMDKLSDHHPEIAYDRREKELKARLGHIPAEVLGGALLGAVIGTAGYLFERPAF